MPSIRNFAQSAKMLKMMAVPRFEYLPTTYLTDFPFLPPQNVWTPVIMEPKIICYRQLSSWALKDTFHQAREGAGE